MKSQSLVFTPTHPAVVVLLLLAGMSGVHARTPKDFFQNSELSDGNNYSPAGTPAASNDVRLTTAATVLTLGTNLSVGSANQTSNLSYTIGSANSSILDLGGGDGNNTIGGNPADVIYVGGATSSLTFQSPLKLRLMGNAQFNVAQAGATLNIASDLIFFFSSQLTKVGAGTLNFSGPTLTLPPPNTFQTLAVNEGIVNFLSDAVINTGFLTLSVNNFNAGVGTAVTVNFYRSEFLAGLGGTIAVPSAGTNTATVNLIGTGTTLSFASRGATQSDYAGTIAGEGSVSVGNSNHLTFPTQRFAGNNTYSGTTTVGQQCHLVIDGNTSGQGNYTVSTPDPGPPGTLLGGGTIGLKANGTITITAAAELAPGPVAGIGTLHVNTSGTGGVIFANGGILAVRVSSVGLSDLLAITGGSITLTGSNDILSLNSLAGAFDGTDYTIATFAQNAGGTFDIVQGLPSDYSVEYNPTSIRLVAIQQPLQLTGAVSRKMHGALGPFDINLLTTDPVECRSSEGNHTLVLTFNNYLVSGSASVTTGTGTISGDPSFSGKTMTVDLIGVSDMQKLVVTLHNVTDRFSQVLSDTPITVNVLIGDTTGNKSVNASDIAQTKRQSGSSTTVSNFREDVTGNGTVSASDVTLVKSRSGAFVPP
jgi:hypothetical protein